jgi:hypothetical protein
MTGLQLLKARHYLGRKSGLPVTEYHFRYQPTRKEFVFVLQDWRLSLKPLDEWLAADAEVREIRRSVSRSEESSVLAVMKYYESPLTRAEFLNLFYMGDVPEEIPAEDEGEFPEQFQLTTLLETPLASEKLQ